MTFRRLLTGLLALGAGFTPAEDYPARPVRIVTNEIGGGNDVAARSISPGLTAHLGRQVIVDNRGALIAAETVARALPDGHTR